MITDGIAIAVVRGSVTDASGDPVPDVEITLIVHKTDCSDSGDTAAPSPVLTDQEGLFRGRFFFEGPGGITVHSKCTELRAMPPPETRLLADTVFTGELRFSMAADDSLVLEIVLPDAK